MQYMLLIYGDEDQRPPDPTTPEEMQAMMQPWLDYGEWLSQEGLMKAGDALQPPTTATTVTTANGEALVSDGPYAETKEQLGGYYLIDAPDLDKAIEAAKRCPGAQFGKVEVRPVAVFD